jgi:hypothetical protein
LLAAVVGFILGGVLLRTLHLRVLGPVVAALSVAPLLLVIFGGGRRGFVRTLVVLLPLVVLSSGTLANDPDPDAGRIRLRRPGDGVRLSLDLPADAKPGQFVEAELLLDMLPSPRGRFTLSIRLSGDEIARYEGRPSSGPEAFLLDREIHREGDRYRRILRSMERHLDGFVRRQRGMKNAGYDYYRQWYRVPLEPGRAFRSSQRVEIVLVSTEGTRPVRGSCGADVRFTGRTISMRRFRECVRAIYYRFDTLLAPRARRFRMIRPVTIHSSRRGRIFDARGRTRLSATPNAAPRKLIGGYGLVSAAGGTGEAGWLADPSHAIRKLTPKEVLFLQADRDHFFSGLLTY